MKAEFVYFDIDNTLLDHTAAESGAQYEIYREYPELQKVRVDIWLSAYKRINHRLWVQYQNGEIGREHLQRTRFEGAMESLEIPAGRSVEIGTRYMQAYRKYWQWVDGAEEALTEISEKYPVGFITNGFRETQQKKIEKMNLNRFSNLFIISEDIGVMKPHHKVFDTAAKKAETDREKILYVGDSYSSDIVGARNAGWKTAWYTASLARVTNGETADILFDHFSGLVDYLIRN
jgi:YjjG family noncanonical pyrimidine nucleotidase